MQNQLFVPYPDYSGQKVLLGASGGINSMAALCWLANMPEALKPAELHLFYAHLEEHSPDTRPFVLAGVEYAKKHFSAVVFAETAHSVLEFFEGEKMIPHPTIAPCTRLLKLEPMYDYMIENQIVDNLVGYVKEEIRRVKNMAKRAGGNIHQVVSESGIQSHFPISAFDNEWCFDIVKREIGWYPAIYDTRNSKGERVFKHNNCLPCKNMTHAQLKDVATYYPEYMQRAKATSEVIGRHWGRDADEYYTTFGRPDYEVLNGQPCAVCAAD